MATHPSGESTLFVKVDEQCGLRRYAADGTRVAETPLSEPDLESDPTDTTWDPVTPWNVGGCQPHELRETARLAADGEHVEARALVRPQSATHLEGLRWLRGGPILVGRVSPAPLPEDGHGWHGFVVRASLDLF
ncbi:MAG TPA: hypothetical protein VFO83_14120 [Aggregicoccus sp.]|nr:hypothetical protein [Aggregicoccus sp.]